VRGSIIEHWHNQRWNASLRQMAKLFRLPHDEIAASNVRNSS